MCNTVAFTTLVVNICDNSHSFQEYTGIVKAGDTMLSDVLILLGKKKISSLILFVNLRKKSKEALYIHTRQSGAGC